MAPYVRGLLFFASLLCAPFVYALGHRLGGDLPAALLSGALVLATFAYMSLGDSEPPTEAPTPGPRPGSVASASSPTLPGRDGEGGGVGTRAGFEAATSSWGGSSTHER